MATIHRTVLLCLALSFALCGIARAADVVEYDLVIAEHRATIAGRDVEVLSINGGVPGPVLRFREGDTARIRVVNRLEHETTSLHWHGILLPPEQDGVPFITMRPIEPGETREFNFTLRQSGTYWYHSHSGLQEQRGVYGAIVVLPRVSDGVDVERDEVVVLSDWTDESPDEVMRTLRRGSEAFAYAKGNVQSIAGAWRSGALGEYFMRERARMPAMDISDVAYDAFLTNGAQHARLPAAAGERVRLRLVNASATTYFFVAAGEGQLEVVAADGQLVEPFELTRLLIGVAETYDVVVTVPSSGALEVRATAQDGSGHTLLTLGDGVPVASIDPPRANLYSMDELLEGALDSARPYVADVAPELARPVAPYRRLIALDSTAFDPRTKVREIELRLTGSMLHYQWGFDGKSFMEEPFLGVHEGEVLRIVIWNDTMMSHPIHIHGHFFRLVNEHGDRSPLKHTVDVPAMGHRTIELLADEPGDWLMHCHVLYHMHAGMTRVLTYRDPAQWGAIDLGDEHHAHPIVLLDGFLATHMGRADLAVVLGNERFHLHADLEFGGDPEREVDFVWEHMLGDYTSLVGGARTTNERDVRNRGFAGVRHVWSWFVATELSADSEGDARIDIEKSFQLDDALALDLRFQYDTGTDGEYEVGLVRRLGRRASLLLHHHSDWGTGLGLVFEL